jgi:hypothetical protein
MIYIPFKYYEKGIFLFRPNDEYNWSSTKQEYIISILTNNEKKKITITKNKLNG